MINRGAGNKTLCECVTHILDLIYELTKTNDLHDKVRIEREIAEVLTVVANLAQEDK